MPHPAPKTDDYRKEATFALSLIGIDVELWLEGPRPEPPAPAPGARPQPKAETKPRWSRRLGA